MINRNCKKCGKEFKVRNFRVRDGMGVYCSRDCYHEDSKGNESWNKGLKGYSLTKKGKVISCEQCGKEKYFTEGQFKRRPCKYCSVDCARKAEKKNSLTVYSSIHGRIKSEFGRADVCDNCGTDKTIIDWANISGKYLLDRSDWKKLCRKCHIEYDKDKNDLAYKNFSHK